MPTLSPDFWDRVLGPQAAANHSVKSLPLLDNLEAETDDWHQIFATMVAISVRTHPTGDSSGGSAL